MMRKAEEILASLQSRANPENVAGMKRFGINDNQTLGISMPVLREIARETGKDHALAQELWASGIHEARILASLVDDASQVSPGQMDRWALDFDSWDVCDQVCGNLFDRTPFAFQKAVEWSARPEEYVRRAGYVLIAGLAVHDKKASDAAFEEFLPLIVQGSTDERNFVRKAVNWALRGIGKRNCNLNRLAIQNAREILKLDSRTARWVAKDALRELEAMKIKKNWA